MAACRVGVIFMVNVFHHNGFLVVFDRSDHLGRGR